MDKTFEKVSEGEVKVIETNVTEKVCDLYALKQRQAELVQSIANRRALHVQQAEIMIQRAQVAMDQEIAQWEKELAEVEADITGAEAVGVIEVPPVIEEPVEEVVEEVIK